MDENVYIRATKQRKDSFHNQQDPSPYIREVEPTSPRNP